MMKMVAVKTMDPPLMDPVVRGPPLMGPCQTDISLCIPVHSSGSDSVQRFSEGEVMNSEGEVVEEGDCPTTDEDSEMDSDTEVVWAKSARGTWG